MTTETLQQEPEVWVMPRPVVGQVVLYYEYGEKVNGIDPLVAIVDSVNAKSINLTTLRGTASGQNIYHISDPRFKKFPDQKKRNGSWDFCPDSPPSRVELEGLAKIVAELTERIRKIEAKNK